MWAVWVQHSGCWWNPNDRMVPKCYQVLPCYLDFWRNLCNLPDPKAIQSQLCLSLSTAHSPAQLTVKHCKHCKHCSHAMLQGPCHASNRFFDICTEFHAVNKLKAKRPSPISNCMHDGLNLLLDLKACKMLLFVSKCLCLCVLCLCPMFACVCLRALACLWKTDLVTCTLGGVTCQCLVPHVTYVAAVMWCQSISMLERYTPCASIPWSKTMYLVSRQKKTVHGPNKLSHVCDLQAWALLHPTHFDANFVTHRHLLPSV